MSVLHIEFKIPDKHQGHAFEWQSTATASVHVEPSAKSEQTSTDSTPVFVSVRLQIKCSRDIIEEANEASEEMFRESHSKMQSNTTCRQARNTGE
jgi:hypothetical protein